MKRRGISLILLVITIIIIIIIAGAVILNLSDSGILDQSKKARFMNDFTSVEEGVNLYSTSKYNYDTGKFELPLKGYLTEEDKTYIKDSVPSLNTKIEELSGSIDTTNLAWISNEDISVKLSSAKREKGYILDVATGQIYDYNGDVFEGKRWHTLDGGVVIGNTTIPSISEEIWDGWIKLTLFYPAGSTDKKWRLGTEGELRVDSMLMWQNYTGAITIPLDRIKDVWIKYKIDNKDVIVPPVGTLLVDIVPDKTGATKVDKVNVIINFDEGATTKEYRVGDSGWIAYTEQFSVTENCIVEARAKKTETIYNTDGTVLATRNVAGKDLVYIGNVGVEETDIAAPTITRLPAIGSEKARVQITYPANANKKIYKLNYGVEENYTSEINITNYGTYIIAYYYDSTGKRSKSTSIYINDTSSGAAAELPVTYVPNPPYVSGEPLPDTVTNDIPNDVPAPTINVTPATLVEEVAVSISAPANANKVYIKLGRYADYQEYTSAIMVRQNTEVYAYYRTYTGEKSNIGYGTVSNIKKNNKPYVYINANPYPWNFSYGASEVNVTIAYSDTTAIEYSEDGIVYNPYTAPFKVTENKKIYARGTNANGVTETSLNITNIGQLKPPIAIKNLAVNINVNPEPAISTDRVATANVTIDYDIKATEKYYSIGRYGTLQTYTGAFDVTSNCTVYAYAKGVNSKGEVSKTIDNLSSGIAEPIISASPSNGSQASKVAVSIVYDKYATIKRYSIDGGSLRDYATGLEVTKNGSVIYAYSQNALGQKSESSYTINNIVPEPPILLLDKGNYYILKLNYPTGSKGREYKWKTDGTWNGYKDAGILLVKPQFKDQVIVNGTLVKIEDENGNLVTFTGDYYLIDVPISELFENLFMRWDRAALGAPQIVITPTEPAISVTATISYNSAIVQKQYKVIKPGEISGIWMDYTGPITIDRNNTLIYAKGMDETEVWSAEGMLKVTNIDEIGPVIKLTADFIAAQQKVAIKVNVTDDVAVGKIKWSAGTFGESYFATSGTEIANDSIVNITSNGYYTFYGEDQVGNKQVYTLNVTNVDLNPPLIDIAISPENTVGLNANVTINYGDSTIKQYKVGTSNSVWTNYTSAFAISSYTILANNWQNDDGTVTVYAKGKDTAGNEITVQKKVVSLDLDKPNAPVINSNTGYPVLTSNGTKIDAATTITYDNRTDINNFYSIDNGVTWVPYVGQFNLASGTVIAKSVKKSTGLETVISQTVGMPLDAMKLTAYDNNDTTYIDQDITYMKVDSSMQNKSIRVYWSGTQTIVSSSWVKVNSTMSFLDSAKQVISSVSYNGIPYIDSIYTVPNGTNWIKVNLGQSPYTTPGRLGEIQSSNEPTFNIVNGYMTLTADSTKAITIPYQNIGISYFTTSVQRLYRIGTTGNWLNYQDQPVKVNQGETLYTKGIDIYGNETRIISSYTANVPDALQSAAYDKNDTTILSAVTNKYMAVDSSMQGKNIRVYWAGTRTITGSSWVNVNSTISFLDSTKQLISSVSCIGAGYVDGIYTVPNGTNWIKVDLGQSPYTTPGILAEIQPSNEPIYTAINGYMLLTLDPAKAIKTPYQMLSISYFGTSVQRLYRIGTTGDWLNYQDKSIKVNQGETIYSKGIDQYGNETRIISSYTASILDALQGEIYDGNDATLLTAVTNKLMQVDSSMQGKNIRIYWTGTKTIVSSSWVQVNSTMSFLNSNKQVISSVVYNGTAFISSIYAIPNGTSFIKIDLGQSPYTTPGRIAEIQPSI